MKKLRVMAALSMLMVACSDDGSSEGAGAGPTGSDAPFTGDCYEIVVDEANHIIDMTIRENLGTCQLSADSTSASWISGPENFTLRFVYEISNDTLLIFKENDYPTKRYGQVFVGNSSTLYGTWSECSHASIRGGEVDDAFEGYTPIDSTVWTFSPGRLTISSFVAGDWDLYKNEFMLNLLNGHYYLRGDQIFHSANNDMAKYAEGVEEVSRNGLDAVFKVGEKILELAMNWMHTDIQMRMYLNFGNVLEICSICKHWLKIINSFAILRPTSNGSVRSSSSVG